MDPESQAAVESPALPPGQREVGQMPVLHVGEVPVFDASVWRLAVGGEVEASFELAWSEVRDLESVEIVADFHAGTGWTRRNVSWRGISLARLIERAVPRPGARYVRFADGALYDATLAIADALEASVLLASKLDGAPLPPRHGGPLRLVVPRKYGWKSVKWVRSIELLAEERPGFWERRGAHAHADPWREERGA